LNLERFDPLDEAKVLVERWRHIYNRIRPYTSLGYRPPVHETKDHGLQASLHFARWPWFQNSRRQWYNY